MIGGGITGAGVARDAASRGLRVALVEARDFAFGTSSRSSKLIHGGIRYLENLEFGLVFEALSERRLLFEIAPHMVHPLRFVLPLYRGGRLSMWKLGAGMWLYDALALFDAPEMHERRDPVSTLNHAPTLRSDGLLGSFAYSDAYMDDDRLVHETLRSANDLGAVSINYVAAQSPLWDVSHQRIIGVQVRDQLSGHEKSVKARHIVSTVGPWTDDLGRRMQSQWQPILRPSKGIHLTLPRERLSLEEAVVMPDDQRNRIVFAIPRYDMVIVGTTDTDFSGDLDSVYAEPADVDYVLGMLAEYFPQARIQKSDIVASYAGVRPLVRDESESEGKTSREHTIFTSAEGITFVAGGKYTTYRLMAQQTVDHALQSFPLADRARLRPTGTRSVINPLASPERMTQALDSVSYWCRNFPGLSLENGRALAQRFGMEAELLLESGPQRAVDVPILEARHAIRSTMCGTLVDFYFRRTHMFLSERDHGRAHLGAVAREFARELNWSDSEMRAQLESLEEQIRRELAWK